MKRMPKTAIAIPQVKNLCRHFGLMVLSFVALTTALSKDRLTSSIPSTNAMNIQISPEPLRTCSPQRNAKINPIIVTQNDSIKYFIK